MTGGFLMALALLLSMGVTAFAYTPLDLGKTGSITVSPANGKSIGTELTIYQVADVTVDNADQKYVLTEAFADSKADLTALEDTGELARKLAAYAAEHKLSGITKSADTGGSVTFDNLELGLYLVIQEVSQPGETIVNPFLVSVPMQDSRGEWDYDVDASPKAETYELMDVSVRKVWNDGGSASGRPSAVTVYLYDGAALVDTVTLNSTGGWSHTWKGLKKSDGYTVKEEKISGYQDSYSQSGNTFTITNTPKLAQTGQLNWPIPLLAGGGVMLFAIGWGMVFLVRKKDA